MSAVLSKCIRAKWRVLIESQVNKAIPAPGMMVSAQRGAEARSLVLVMQSREKQRQQHLCRLHYQK